METLTPKKAKNGKWGYVNEKGKWVIKAQFDLAKAFINYTAIVKVNGKYGIICVDGSYALEPELDDAWSWEEFIVARYEEDDSWGLMDRFGECIQGFNHNPIEGPTKNLQTSNIISHDYLELWDDNGDGLKLFSGGYYEYISEEDIYFEEED